MTSLLNYAELAIKAHDAVFGHYLNNKASNELRTGYRNAIIQPD